MKFLSQEVIQTCIKTLKYQQMLIRKKQMPKIPQCWYPLKCGVHIHIYSV